jgi:hypothetical protein
MTHFLAALAAAAIVAAPSLAAGPSPKTVVQTDHTWVCSGAVDLDSVTVTMTPSVGGSRQGWDAVHLQPGCTGTIGRIDVTTSVADGIKVAAGVHDLVVGGGTIRCLAKAPVLHQDGIQVLGGDRITFRNMNVDCGRPAESLINSNMFINMAGRATTPPTDVVCDGCSFGGGAAHTVLVQNSIRSGVENSTLCRAKYPNLTLTIGSAAIDPVNVGNKLLDCGDSGGGGTGGTGATKLTLKAQFSAITFGHSVVLTGSFGKDKSGRSVTMYARPYGASAFTAVSTVRTDPHGGWRLTVRPGIGTSYRAVSRASTSPTIAVGVRPLVKLTASHGGVAVHVTARKSFRGRTVVIQKLRGTHWVTLSRLVLGSTGTTTMKIHAVRVRAVVPAAPGYLQSVSSALKVP